MRGVVERSRAPFVRRTDLQAASSGKIHAYHKRGIAQIGCAEHWNGDGGYVEAPPAGLKGWIGPAAPQDASVPGYMLPGSGEQIWLPSNVAKPGAPIATPWNGARSK